MTKLITLKDLKTTAKRIARVRRIAHHEALDLIATRMDQPHWNAFAKAWDKGWRPEESAVESLLSLETTIDAKVMAIEVLGIGQGVEDYGVLEGRPYVLRIDFEVIMAEIGSWCICLGHAPSDKPLIEIYDGSDDNPILNPLFRAKAMAICNEATEKLRARISADWPRRSTKPDAEGKAQHPLTKGVASEWYCLHCDGTLKASELAGNMWHCPECSATPLDIFSDRFWKAAS